MYNRIIQLIVFVCFSFVKYQFQMSSPEIFLTINLSDTLYPSEIIEYYYIIYHYSIVR